MSDAAGSRPDDPVLLDLDDFDAVGVAGAIVDVVRSAAIQREVDVAATVSAPDGWHRVVVTGRRSGHVVMSVRYAALSRSRRHTIDGALAKRGWELDDDAEGATFRIPPGTEATTVAFELLAVLIVAGAPAGVRQATAVDAAGTPVALL